MENQGLEGIRFLAALLGTLIGANIIGFGAGSPRSIRGRSRLMLIAFGFGLCGWSLWFAVFA